MYNERTLASFSVHHLTSTIHISFWIYHKMQKKSEIIYQIYHNPKVDAHVCMFIIFQCCFIFAILHIWSWMFFLIFWHLCIHILHLFVFILLLFQNFLASLLDVFCSEYFDEAWNARVYFLYVTIFCASNGM